MLGRAPSADTSGAKQLRHHYPGVLKNLLLAERSKGDRRVISGMEPLDPTLRVPPGKQFGGCGARHGEGGANVVNRDQVSGLSQDETETASGFADGISMHGYNIYAVIPDLRENMTI